MFGFRAGNAAKKHAVCFVQIALDTLLGIFSLKDYACNVGEDQCSISCEGVSNNILAEAKTQATRLDRC